MVSEVSELASSELGDLLPGASVGFAGLAEDMVSEVSELTSSVVDKGLDGSLGLGLELLVVHEVSSNALGSALLGGVSFEVSHDSLVEHLLGVVFLGVLVDSLLDGLNIQLVGGDFGVLAPPVPPSILGFLSFLLHDLSSCLLGILSFL